MHAMKELAVQDKAIWTRFQKEFAARGIEKPRIVIHGGYGKHNLGDDAILEAILLRLESLWPQARVSVLCHDPRPVHTRHPSVNAHSFKSWGALRAICSSDLYVIGGGGIVNRINTYSGFTRLRALDPKGKFLFLAGWLSKLCGARLVFYSVGTTSMPDRVVGWLVRAVVSRADSVSVRDPLSLKVLRETGVTRDVLVLPDPATGLRPVGEEQATEILLRAGVDVNRPLIGICMRYVREPGISNAETVVHTARVIEWLIESQAAQVLFVPFGRHPRKQVENDVAFAREVRAQLSSDRDFFVLDREYRPAEVQAILARMNVCILERLHACILATSVHTPLIAVAYDAKVSEFMKLSGQGERVIPLRDFSLETVQAKWRELELSLNHGLASEDF